MDTSGQPAPEKPSGGRQVGLDSIVLTLYLQNHANGDPKIGGYLAALPLLTFAVQLRYMRILNLVNGLAALAAAVLGFLFGIVDFSVVRAFLASYTIVFGVLMCCAECHFRNMEQRIRNNFGFMFSYCGRALYIFFLATMCFAMNYWIGYVAGGLTCLNGFFNCYVIKMHPAFTRGELSASDDPYAGYTSGESEIQDYIAAHPELAKKALKTGVHVARENPQIVREVVASEAVNPFAADRA